MCGIVGVINIGRKDNISKKKLINMRDTMFHRGPDGSGIWISKNNQVGFAHRRLSIIDLSEQANQPMLDDDEELVLIFNGEIYNHLSLRKELQKIGYIFKTSHSDTEVILHGYKEWGLEVLLEKISGDYAFAIWDVKKNLLSLARDKMGVKPLYFNHNKGRFTFASEIKAIVADKDIERDIDPIAMNHYLTFLITPAPLTMFKGIYKIPAGYFLQIDINGEINYKKYWDLEKEEKYTKNINSLSFRAQEEYYCKLIKEKLTNSIEKRMMSDVGVGVFLSGGIDSTLNLALMNKFNNKKIDSFTVGYKDLNELNETENARKVSKLFNSNHHEIILDKKDVQSYLDQLIYFQDEPIADWVCIPLHFISNLSKKNSLKVVQVGEGSDEQFFGYENYVNYFKLYKRYWLFFQNYIPNIIQKKISKISNLFSEIKPELMIYSDLIERAAFKKEHFWGGAIAFRNNMKNKLFSEEYIKNYSYHNDVFDNQIVPKDFLNFDSHSIVFDCLKNYKKAIKSNDILSRMMYLEFKIRLPELLLMRVDKMTMSNSLEARVPFLDKDLVNLSFNINDCFKYRNKEKKYILKKAIKGIIPEDIIYRKKMGFLVPIPQWLNEEFGDNIKRKILKSKFLKRNYFNKQYIENLFYQHKKGKINNATRIWVIFNLVSWYDFWIEGLDPNS